MKTIPSLCLLTALFTVLSVESSFAADEDGVALAILYDTSGSMRETVRDKDGKFSPKFTIANRALSAVATQIEAFATNTTAGSSHRIDTALFTFDKSNGKEVIKLGPFDAKAIREWAANFSNPDGGTPLGTALNLAARAVLDSPLPHKHVLIITDGVNTIGPQPAEIMSGLLRQAERKQSTLEIHFLAFDVDAQVFAPAKKLGATVVGAVDEVQLNTQLDFILQKKILLEAEEPAKKK